MDVIFNRIKEKTSFLCEYENKKENILLIGHVQSGKTIELLAYCWWSIFVLKTSVIVFVRNFKIDITQLVERICIFNQTIVIDSAFFLEIHNEESEQLIKQVDKQVDKQVVFIRLQNHIQATKMLKIIREKNLRYHLCIDEADYAVKSTKNISKFECYMKYIEKGSSHTLVATATPFAVLAVKKEITKVLRLTEPKDYKNLEMVNKKFVHVNFPISQVPHEDPNLDIIYPQFLKKKHGIMFHLVTRKKGFQMCIMEKLASMFKKLTVLVYNGDGAFIQTNDNHRLNYNGINYSIKQSTNGRFCHWIRKIQLNKVLQILKEDTVKHNHIVIIGGNMISRGVSVVSEDYKWHLTDQYFHPSKSSHGENIIQSLRILGKYNDNLSLTLWCTPDTWNDILEQMEINKKIDKYSGSSRKIDIKKPNRNPTRKGVMQNVKFESNNKNGKDMLTLADIEDTVYSDEEQ